MPTKMIPDLTLTHIAGGATPAQMTYPDTSAGVRVIPMGSNGGDVTGPSNANVVTSIQGVAVAGQDSALGDVLTITSPGTAEWAPAASPSAAITQLTADVTAGPGPGSVPATVAAIQGVAISGTPALNDVLTATAPNAAHWAPSASPTTAITQLTGDVMAGPGPGSVPGTVAAIQGVAISGAPTAGQVLTATTPTAAHWATPSAGGSKDYAAFFALMPGDNTATVAVGAAVQFPQDGPTAPLSGITRLTASTFQIAVAGNYEITWQVAVSESGQLQVAIGGIGLADTVIGRAALTSQFFGNAMITTSVPNSVLSIINPLGNSTALTITPTAGGTSPVSATLSIKAL